MNHVPARSPKYLETFRHQTEQLRNAELQKQMNPECTLCSTHDSQVVPIKCEGSHSFHPECIYKIWIQNKESGIDPSCPTCRHPIQLLGELNQDQTNLNEIHEPLQVQTCSRCLKKLWGKTMKYKECGHTFHKKCLSKYLLFFKNVLKCI